MPPRSTTFVLACFVLAIVFSSGETSSCWLGREFATSFDRISQDTTPLITVCPSLRIDCHGHIASWRTSLNVADNKPINLAVFRPIHNGSEEIFIMVGYNTFSARKVGRNIFDVPEEKRLSVEPGDVFGYFRMGSGVNEFLSFVGKSGRHKRAYDSCLQASMSYIDLIKADYRLHMGPDFVPVERLYSLSVEIETKRLPTVPRLKRRYQNSARQSGRAVPSIRKPYPDHRRHFRPSQTPIPPTPVPTTTPKPTTSSTFPPAFVTFSQDVENAIRRQIKHANYEPKVNQGDGVDRGLLICGSPPNVENAFSVNDLVPSIRLPSRQYQCLAGYTPVGFNRYER